MADDGVIRISTQVDITNLQSGMDGAQAAVESATADMESSFAGLSESFDQVTTSTSAAADAISSAYAQMEAQGTDTVAAMNAVNQEAAAVAIESAADAATAVEESVDIQAAAYAQLVEAKTADMLATKLLAGAYKQLQEGELEAGLETDILAGFEDIAAQASANLKAAKANLAEVTQFLNAETSVEVEVTEAATEATLLFGAAQEELATSGGHAVSQMAATSGAVRVFEGALPIRAVENFLTKTLGLGPIISAAFPIIGAVAFGEVIGEVAEKAYKAYENAEQAGTRITESFQKTNDTLRTANDSLDITNDKLENTLAKLEHRPQNGLALALDEARQAADQLAKSIDNDIDKVDELMKKNKVSLFGQILGKSSTDGDAKQITAYDQRIKGIISSYTDTIDDATNRGASQSNIAEIKQKELTKLEASYGEASKIIGDKLRDIEAAQETFNNSGGKFGTDYSARIAQMRGALAAWQQEQQNIGGEYRKGQLEGQVAPLQADKANHSGDNKANEARMRAMEESLNQQKLDHEVSAADEVAYWSKYTAAFTEGSSQYIAVSQKLIAAKHKASEEFGKDVMRQIEDDEKASASGEKMSSELIKTYNDISKSQEEAAKTQEEANAQMRRMAEINAQNTASMKLAQLAADEASGKISKLGAAHQAAAIHAQDYADKLKALKAQLDAINAEQPTNQKEQDSQSARSSSVQAQMEQVKGQQQVSGVQDQTKITQDISAPYLKAFDQIESGWMRAQQQMLAGHKTFAQAMNQMAGSLVMSMIEGFEKAALKFVQQELVQVAAHTAANQAKVLSTATAATQTSTIEGATNLKSITSSAASAAAKAYNSMAGIPIVGPELGAVAAAATFIAVEAFGSMASFDVGTNVVPRDMIAQIHAGEQIVPKAYNPALNGAAAPKSVNATLNYHAYGSHGSKPDAAAGVKQLTKSLRRMNAI